MKWIKKLLSRLFKSRRVEPVDLEGYLLGSHITKTTGKLTRKK